MKENDIRPKQIFDEFLDLVRQDSYDLFPDKSAFRPVPCPACTEPRHRPGLVKYDFQYVVCAACGTLYASPRPDPVMIDNYYQRSKAVKYWGTDFFKRTRKSRREKIFRPRAHLVVEWVDRVYKTGEKPGLFLDIGSGDGMFLEEILELNRFETLLGLEPAPNLAAICKEKGFKVIEKKAESVAPNEIKATFATSFEVLEHLHDPSLFLNAVYRMLAPGGLFMFTTLTVSGFDIQILWDRSKNINPPQHLNFISVAGMKRLLERIGFEIRELSTPGKLDVDIVKNAYEADQGIALPRFVLQIINNPCEKARKDFQQFLRSNRLSSHIRVVAQRPKEGLS